VITTKFAPWQDLETQGCGWWIDLEEDALVAAMEEAMRLPRAALQARGTKGRAWVADAYGWPKIGNNLSALYSWITGAGAQPSFVCMFEGAPDARLGMREHLAAGHRT